MSKKTPSSKYAVKQGRDRYRAERERHRKRIANKLAEKNESTEVSQEDG